MRIIMLLCVLVCLLLAACTTTVPEELLQSQSSDPLPWQKPDDFWVLEPERDYFPNELIAIFYNGNGSDGGDPNLIINQALDDAVGLIVNGIKIQPDSIVLLGTYATEATAVTLAPTPVCGEVISHFSYSFPSLAYDKELELEQAKATLLAISAGPLKVQAQGNELYAISPRGMGPGGTNGSEAGTLEASKMTKPFNPNPFPFPLPVSPAFPSGHWYHAAVNAVPGISALGVDVAVLDTGVNPVGSFSLRDPANFVQLDQNNNFTRNADDDFDDSRAPYPVSNPTPYLDGHGTGVAALIADSTYGIAPGATIIPVKTCDESGMCDDITVTRGICYAQSVGADVINLSLGTLNNAPMLQQAINEVVASGTTVIAAAGNSNNSAQYTGRRQNKAVFPAAWATDTKSPFSSGFMSVGAIDQNLEYADFATSHESVELIAPGSDVWTGTGLPDTTGVETFSADGQAAFMEGTSFAAPMVAAAVANLYSQCPNLSTMNIWDAPVWVEQTLLSTATPWNPVEQPTYRPSPLPWPLSMTGFTPGIINVGDSLRTPCP